MTTHEVVAIDTGQTKVPAAGQPPRARARPAGELDRLIESFYDAAAVKDWQQFRTHCLRALCQWSGAASGAWLLRAQGGQAGEFTQWPATDAPDAATLASLTFSSKRREIEIAWPQHGQPVACGLALEASHRGTHLYSVIALRVDAGAVEREPLRRALGHLVQAATVALRQFVQRDEWLMEMGRSSRGPAALVDRDGGVYILSDSFRRLLISEHGDPDAARLPLPLPAEGLRDGSSFHIGSLHFRVRQQGEMFLINARRPHPLDVLSPREQEIARALALGKTFKSVAREFTLAISTVANHASRIYRKLGIYRREELAELLRRTL